MEKLKNSSINRLFEAIAGLETAEECAAFFEDLCTVKELSEMSQRLEAAYLLSEGEAYQAISKKLGISTATISRVSRCLNYGSGGYRLVIGERSEK